MLHVTHPVCSIVISYTDEMAISIPFCACTDTHTHTHTYTQPSAGGTVDQIPLLVAAGNGHTDIVQLLVQHGANVNTQVGHMIVI